MNNNNKRDETEAGSSENENVEPGVIDRRQALFAAGKFAAYVAPVMTVLISAERAGAHHKPWHQSAGNGGSNCQGWAENQEICSTY